MCGQLTRYDKFYCKKGRWFPKGNLVYFYTFISPPAIPLINLCHEWTKASPTLTLSLKRQTFFQFFFCHVRMYFLFFFIKNRFSFLLLSSFVIKLRSQDILIFLLFCCCLFSPRSWYDCNWRRLGKKKQIWLILSQYRASLSTTVYQGSKSRTFS